MENCVLAGNVASLTIKGNSSLSEFFLDFHTEERILSLKTFRWHLNKYQNWKVFQHFAH